MGGSLLDPGPSLYLASFEPVHRRGQPGSLTGMPLERSG